MRAVPGLCSPDPDVEVASSLDGWLVHNNASAVFYFHNITLDCRVIFYVG